MVRQKRYWVKGQLLGACNCAWGCPCNFEASPTYGPCEGAYVWRIETGRYNGVNLDGLVLAEISKFPGAVHLGNGTSVYLVDERADETQRTAIETMVNDEAPFSVFLSLSSEFFGFQYVPFSVELNGTESSATIPGVLDLQLAPMTNPVTGEVELATLNKPTGFTSQMQELCTTGVFKYDDEMMSLDYAGKYGEFSPFEYSGD